MEKIDGKTLDNHQSKLIVSEQTVLIGGEYRFTIRPLTAGMTEYSKQFETNGERAMHMLRLCIVSASHFNLEFEQVAVFNATYQAVTVDSLRLMPDAITNTLYGLMAQMNMLNNLDAIQVDFTPAV